MDNITHSLFGYALGRASARAANAGTASAFERALVASGVLASNAPDLDFVTGLFGEDKRLMYLLEHRGFTHTLAFAGVIGLLVGIACAMALRLRAPRERWAVAALGAVACVFHVGFDFLNDYGVHPFYPFDNRWYYGDSVFIVEPLLIAVLLPLPMFFALSVAGRAIAGALSLGLLLLVWIAGANVSSAMLTTVVLVLACFTQLRVRARASPALAASAIVVGLFALGSRLAEAEVVAALRAGAPAERVLDIASIPVPANPTCHRTIALTLDPNGIYRARLARTGVFRTGASCALLPSEPTAPLTAAELPGTAAVRFERTFAAPAAELTALAQSKCDAAAMLRFVRVPFWTQHDERSVLGDLRYDRGPTLEFAERLLTGICNAGRAPLAPWVPPREDLLTLPKD